MLTLRNIAPLIRLCRRNISTSKPRAGDHGTYFYRERQYHKPRAYWTDRILGQTLGGFFAFWTLYHLTHNFDLVVGAFPYLNPKKDFTDKELGIPPDSEGLAPMVENPKSIIIPQHPNGQVELTGPYMLKRFFDHSGPYEI